MWAGRSLRRNKLLVEWEGDLVPVRKNARMEKDPQISSNGSQPPSFRRVPRVDALTRLALMAGAGDHRALDQLVEGSYELVWRFCARMVDEQSSDDLAQESFMRAVTALPRFRADSSVRTWIISIARNVCMDELRARSRQRRRDTSLANHALTGGGKPPNADGQVIVTDLLTRLAPERREAFVLTHVLGFSYQAAADVCARPIGTIRSQVARARMDLLAALEEYDRSRDPSVGERSAGPLPGAERRTS